MIFKYINVCPVPREMLKTSAYGLGFQHLPRDLANVNAWKTMFDPYIHICYINMVQKLHSVRLLVLYDSMHIRFHMACFAIQTHPESTQSLILIFIEGELWV